MIAVVMAAHYLTPADHTRHYLHTIYERLAYIPIILIAARWGRRPGVLAALVVCLLFLVHVLRDLGGELLGENLNRTLEMVMYLTVGWLVGLYADIRRQNGDALRAATLAVVRVNEDLAAGERLRAVGLLSAEMAHEVRNPLASMRGLAELLGDVVGPGHPRAELVTLLQKEVQRLDAVVENFLRLARGGRPPQGAAPATPAAAAPATDRAAAVREVGAAPAATADLAEEVATVAALLRPRCADLGVTLRAPAPGAAGAARVPLSPERARQLVLNLALNAVQAVGRGGTVHVRLLREARADAPGRADALVFIDDDGPGLPAGDPDRLFDPFVTSRDDGTGLGLTIARGIARFGGGEVTLCNRAGVEASHPSAAGGGAAARGARAIIRLPIEEP